MNILEMENLFQPLSTDKKKIIGLIRECIPTEELKEKFDNEVKKTRKNSKSKFIFNTDTNVLNTSPNHKKRVGDVNNKAKDKYVKITNKMQPVIEAKTAADFQKKIRGQKELIQPVANITALAEHGASLPIYNLAQIFIEGYWFETNYDKAYKLLDIIPEESHEMVLTCKTGLLGEDKFGLKKDMEKATKMIIAYGKSRLTDEDKALIDNASIGNETTLEALHTKGMKHLNKRKRNKRIDTKGSYTAAYVMLLHAADLDYQPSQKAMADYYQDEWGGLKNWNISSEWSARAKETKKRQEMGKKIKITPKLENNLEHMVQDIDKDKINSVATPAGATTTPEPKGMQEQPCAMPATAVVKPSGKDAQAIQEIPKSGHHAYPASTIKLNSGHSTAKTRPKLTTTDEDVSQGSTIPDTIIETEKNKRDNGR